MRFFSAVQGKTMSFSSLLSTNAKLGKSAGSGARMVGMPLAPSRASGRNVCAGATDACRQACVTWFAGRKVMSSVRQACIARTLFFFEHQSAFFSLLGAELQAEAVSASAEGDKLFFRPNESSDIPWERFGAFPWLCPCYDYCAFASRVLQSLEWSHDYHLTLSVKETTTLADVRRVLDAGGNVAAVVDVDYCPQRGRIGSIPATIKVGRKSFPTVDGDAHDLRRREVDGCGKVVLLRLKGTNEAKAHARALGFAKDISGGKLSLC